MKKRLSLCLALPLVLLTACSSIGGSNYEPDKLPLNVLPGSSSKNLNLDGKCSYLSVEDVQNFTSLNKDLKMGTDASFEPPACLFLDGQKPAMMVWVRNLATEDQAKAVAAGYLPLSKNRVQMGDWRGLTYGAGDSAAASYYKDNKVVTVVTTVPGVRVENLEPIVRQVIEKNDL